MKQDDGECKNLCTMISMYKGGQCEWECNLDEWKHDIECTIENQPYCIDGVMTKKEKEWVLVKKGGRMFWATVIAMTLAARTCVSAPVSGEQFEAEEWRKIGEALM